VQDVTALLRAWGSGDEAALGQLMPVVYDEIHRLARRYMSKERPGHALQTTALVHEVYFRLIDVRNLEWQNRNHFYALCASLMRRVLVDFARAKNFQKREGGFAHINIDEAPQLEGPIPGAEVVAVDEALRKLATLDPRKSQMVELRFFGGLTTSEIAAVLGISAETVLRDWKLAKAWLLRELSDVP
jgi:RNA polymerase sigma factor (TIGR02999 family)